MKISEIWYLVMVNVTQNKFKVLLTSLGIIVGAATIVMVIAIGVGGQMDVADQFKNLNAGTIEIESTSSSTSSMMSARGPGAATISTASSSTRAVLSNDDIEEMMFFIDGIEEAVLLATTSQSVFGGDLDESTTASIVGTSEEYAHIVNLNMAIGEFITQDMETAVETTVVLGSSLATTIFGSASAAYGNIVAIDDRAYTVVGVLSSVNSLVNGVNVDNAAYVPYTTADKYLLSSTTYPEIIAVAADFNDVSTIIAKMNVLLTEIHPTGTFTISDAGSEMEAALSSANTLSVLLISVATIVFIVGGIGIMNVLFVSVKERTQEIGVLKALGTSKIDILLQFLFEANLISIIGGVIGVALSYALMPLMEYTGIRAEPTASAAVMALLFAVGTGTIFGFYPAYQAASLRPIEALNND
ncbi:MAG: hypothetical protein BEN18_08630 [Epulopiscium sp. Nuni2H_MBin001]|nr:MAG: hypothetical protein BEN18_08630 [Epulopiscium sp. Nuni2H_MBin001]